MMITYEASTPAAMLRRAFLDESMSLLGAGRREAKLYHGRDVEGLRPARNGSDEGSKRKP